MLFFFFNSTKRGKRVKDTNSLISTWPKMQSQSKKPKQKTTQKHDIRLQPETKNSWLKDTKPKIHTIFVAVLCAVHHQLGLTCVVTYLLLPLWSSVFFSLSLSLSFLFWGLLFLMHYVYLWRPALCSCWVWDGRQRSRKEAGRHLPDMKENPTTTQCY